MRSIEKKPNLLTILMHELLHQYKRGFINPTWVPFSCTRTVMYVLLDHARGTVRPLYHTGAMVFSILSVLSDGALADLGAACLLK